ncbi:MAG: AgmX/PglI C-terminal domain-containing protein, partial [Pseudomonadota bacterium]
VFFWGTLLAVALPWNRTIASDPVITLDDVVGKVVRANYSALHDCYRKVLAEDRAKAGTIFIQTTLGEDDSIEAAKVVHNKIEHPEALNCIVHVVENWKLNGAKAAGVSVGSEIVIPLTFMGDPAQFVVSAGDVRSFGLENGTSFAKELLTETNVGANKAMLRLLSIQGGQTFFSGDRDRVFFVLEGKGLLRFGKELNKRNLIKEMALWLPAGYGPLNVTVSSRMLLMLEFSIGKTDSIGLSVAREPVLARKPQEMRFSGGKFKVLSFLHSKNMGHKQFSLNLLSGKKGASLFGKKSSVSNEMFFVRKGKGSITLGEVGQSLEINQAAYLPEGKTWSLKVDDAMEVVHFQVPAGRNNQRFGRQQ